MLYSYISKKKGSIPTWKVRMLNPEGKKIQIDTGIQIKGEEGSKEWLASRKKAELKEIEIKSQINLAKKTATRKDEAYQIANIIAGVKADEKIPVERMRDNISETLASTTRKAQNCAVNKLLVYCLKHKVAFLGDITRATVKGFIDSMIADKMKAKSIRVNIIHLSTLYSRTLPEAKENPFSHQRIYTSKLDKTVNRKSLTMAELDLVLEKAKKHEDLYEYISLAIRVGQRKGDLCLLKWKDIDFGRKTIKFLQHKTGETILIPFFDKLERILIDLKARHEKTEAEDYVFPLFAHYYRTESETLTRWVKKAIEEALGVETTVKTGYGKIKSSLYDIHALRTSFVCNMAKKGIPVEAIMKFTGHRSYSTILNHYLKTTALDYTDSVKAVLN